MKPTAQFFARLLSVLVLMICAIGGRAETRISTVMETTTTTGWYSSPWVWIGGAIIFILMLSVLMGGGRRHSDGE